MRLLQPLIYAALALIFATGAGWVAARVNHRPDLAVFCGTWLVRGLYLAGAALVVALAVGAYHLYLYLFTRRRPVSLLATTDKEPS